MPPTGKRAPISASASLLLAISFPARACPVCDSDQGRQVREGVFDEHLVSNLFATSATFPVLLGLVAVLYAIMPSTSRRTPPHAPPPPPPPHDS